MSGNSSRGFTLPEIVIAIAMAQVLAAVAIPRFLCRTIPRLTLQNY